MNLKPIKSLGQLTAAQRAKADLLTKLAAEMLSGNLLERFENFSTELSELKQAAERIKNLPRGDRGLKGDPGRDGKDGAPGRDGKDGRTPDNVDIVTLADAVYELVLSNLKTPKDGKDAVIDKESIVADILEQISGGKVIRKEHIFGLEPELASVRSLAGKQYGKDTWARGGGTTVSAGTNITLTPLPNGTTRIDATGGATGITSINADSTAAQLLVVGTTGTDFAIVDNGTGTHTFNLPTASAVNRGALSAADWTTFNNKGSGTVTSVSGTANRITSTGGATPVIDIAATYVGQTSITTLGTIATGVWNATVISLAKGGTGAALSDPGADAVYVWDDTTNATRLATLSGLTYDTATNVLTATGSGGVPTQITVANEATDTSCFIGFFTAATGDLGPKTNAGLTFNSNTSILTATGFVGPLTGNVTGNVSGTAATVTTAAQPAITSVGTLTVLQVDNLNINGNTISATSGAVNITPEAGSAIVLDGTISVDAGVVTGATSITSTTFVGALTGNASTATTTTNVTAADEATDTTCFINFTTAATGTVGIKTNTNMTFNSNTGVVTFASSVLTTTDINGGTIDGTIIGGSSAAAATITTLIITSFGANWTNAGRTVADLGVVTTVDINGGTVDGTVIGASSAAAITGTVITANTSVLPDANDGAVLGAAGTAFSDLFLAEGGVINWDSSDVTLTQTGNILAVAGGDFRVATADVGTNADSVPTLTSTNTLTNKTLTAPTINAATLNGTITLTESTSIALDPAQADGTWTGITRAGTAGAALAFGQLVYLAAADSRWELADADAATTSDRMLGMVVLAAAADGDPTVILLMGNIQAASQFPAMTIGSAMYVGETAGAIQVAIPTGADNVIRRVGYALTADELYFNPSMDAQTTVA